MPIVSPTTFSSAYALCRMRLRPAVMIKFFSIPFPFGFGVCFTHSLSLYS